MYVGILDSFKETQALICEIPFHLLALNVIRDAILTSVFVFIAHEIKYLFIASVSNLSTI